MSSTAIGQTLVHMGLSDARIALRPEFSFRNGNIYLDVSSGLYTKSLSSTDTTWKRISPDNTIVASYVFNGDSLLIITEGGPGNCIELSTDHGDSWSNFTNGFGGPAIDFQSASEFAQSPHDPLVIYGMAGNCVAKSTDFGNNWTVVKNSWGHISYQPVIMRAHPFVPDLVISGGEAGNFHSYLDISYNAGTSWTQHDVEANDAVNCIAFHPSDAAIMFTGKEGKINRSLDSGKTWSTVFKPPHGMYIRAIDYPFAYSDHVYAVGAYNSVNFAKDSVHLFRSTDKGGHWEKVFQYYLTKCGGVAEMHIFDSTLYFMTFSKGVYSVGLNTLPVGIQEPQATLDYQMQISQGEVIISSPSQPITSLRVFDLQGRQLYLGANASQFQVKTGHWKKGLYIVRIESEQALYSEKFLINR